MAIVYQTDKRSGITYAYQSISHWDKEKKQSRAQRTLLGRVNPETHQIMPTDGRCRAKSNKPQTLKGQPKPTVASRLFCGATYLLDEIGEKLGITQDLKACFPDTYKEVLSLCYYLIVLH